MKIDPNEYRVRPGEKVDLAQRPTSSAGRASKTEYDVLLREHVTRLSAEQQRLYASAHQALLIVFQGMDAAGKDGAIRHVMSGVNPQGCAVYSFKQPSAEELQHDFLWRSQVRLPGRGRIGIFNRSYYEEVLIVRVHPEQLANEALAHGSEVPKGFWKDRYRSISEFEAHLHRNGTRIVKFFLHLSKEEQRRRFLERIDDPQKNWKFGEADVRERQFWKQYMKAYEHCLSATSSPQAPWFVVPADDKDSTRLIVSEIILATLEDMDLHYPPSDARRAAELQAIRKELESGS
jgi:PPK2 family polyphosphate:nucleotide phosphotransferase